MRLLQVLPRYAPAWSYGGGVRMFWQLALEFRRRGHEVHVVTSDSLGPSVRAESLSEDLEGGIHVDRYRNRFNQLSTRLGPVFYRPNGMRDALRSQAGWADVIHMGESRGRHNLWAAEASRSTRTPLVWSAYGGLPTARGIRGLYRRLYDIAFTDGVVESVDRFIGQTEHELKVYRAHNAPHDRLRLIPLCIEWRDFASPPPRDSFRRRLGLAERDQLVVSVARLSPVKGMDLLVRAFSRIPRSDDGPYLALVGWDHGAEASLRRLVDASGLSDRIFFPGPVLGQDRISVYSSADVFALAPAVYEETSLAALEAAAVGRPTVLTRECEVPTLVEAGGGLVVERSEAAIASAIEGLLEAPDDARQMGNAARAAVQEHLTVDRIATAHERLFAELC